MEITAYKTPKVTAKTVLLPLLNTSLPILSEGDIIVVTSKIISICQGRIVKNDGSVKKTGLIKKEAQWYVPPGMSKYDASLSVKDNVLVSAAGIDESNGDGYFVLWPQEPYKAAAEIWSFLRTKNSLRHLGVIISDSVCVPLRWGTRGVAIAWCGLEPLRDYRGKPDIFGRPFIYTKFSIIDSLATAAILAMGEGNEQTPLALMRHVANVVYTNRPPTQTEIEKFRIDPKDDLFAPLMQLDKWKKGESR